MKRRSILCLLLAGLVAGATVGGQAAPGPQFTPWTVEVSPALTLPLADPNELFSLSYGARLGAGYRWDRAWQAGAALSYGYGTLRSDITPLTSTISETTASLNGTWSSPLGAALSLRARFGAGMAFGALNGGTRAAVYPTLDAGAGLGYRLSPEWAFWLDAGWSQKIGLYGGLQSGFAVAWNVPTPRTTTLGSSSPRLRLLNFSEPKMGSVFPILQTYYDENAIGTIRITNTGTEVATSLKASFLVRQYMDAPKDCLSLPSLAPGASAEIPLYALFRNNILDVTEATKAAAEITVEYQTGQGLQSQTSNVSLRVYDRNALTWDDDRKAAAFVSGKDPWVLELSNNLTATVKDLRNGGINKNVQTALAFHNGLKIYGLSYVVNPKNPFAKAFANPEAVDFVKFPRQTLSYKAGDCSDLSVLYASLFESVGIETAFVTIPGHIFLAVNLEVAPDQVRAVVSQADDLIFLDGKSWMPLEVTMRDSALVDIWREAAREWRRAKADGTEGFYPVHDAWKTFPPVGLSADNTSADALPKNQVALTFETELKTLVQQELNVRLEPLNATLKSGATPKALNSRGVLYARYDRWAEAEKDFRAASVQGSYAPAFINLGNIAFLKADNAGAFVAYQKAARLVPTNAKLQINLARAAQALGKTNEAAQAMAVAMKLDPQLASPYSSVAAASDSGNRAAEKGTDAVLWEVE